MPQVFLTAKQRAEKLVAEFAAKTGTIASDGTAYPELVEMARIAFKEQDRDTRHACAEKVIQCKELKASDNLTLIDVDDAHSACMNVSITGE